MKTFFLLLDAFRHDYLSEEHTPFLHRCAREGEHYQRLIPSLGFCERSEILTGLTAEETGFFTAIGYDPDNSDYGQIRGLGLLHALERTALPLLSMFGTRFASRAHGRLRRHADQLLKSRGRAMKTQMIPFHLLRHFALTEDLVDHREPNVFPRPSLLDELTAAGRKYDYDSFTAVGGNFPYRSDDQRIAALCEKAGTSDAELFLAYVGLPDAFGHAWGPDSDELRAALRGLDRKLEDMVERIRAAADGARFVFVGDHGMLEVTRKVDVERDLLAHFRRERLRVGTDVLYFLDSTLARVWALSERARDAVDAALGCSEVLRTQGRVLDAAASQKYHVPFGDRRYGDHIWLANPGVMISPDFFHRISTEKGMHGYDPFHSGSQGVCIVFGDDVPPKVEPSIPLAGVHGVLRRSLELA